MQTSYFYQRYLNVSLRGNTNDRGDEDNTQFQTCSYLPDSMLVTVNVSFLLNSWASLWGKYYHPIAQRRKLKFRDIKTFTQHHVAGKQQRQNLFLRNFFSFCTQYYSQIICWTINNQFTETFFWENLKKAVKRYDMFQALPSKPSDRLIWWHIHQWSILSFTESKWELLPAHFSHLKQY